MGDGRYQLGREIYEPCDEGYKLVYMNGSAYEPNAQAQCMNMSQDCIAWRQGYGGTGLGCEPLPAIRRAKPNFIEMWANGEYIGKFWY